MIQELITHIVKSLVENEQAVLVEVHRRGEVDVVEINLDSADRGKVIGREGHTIKTIRSLVSLLITSGHKVHIDVVQT